MRTARQLFQDSPVFRGFKAILENPAFEPACNAAMVSLVESMPGQNAEPSRAWDCYLQIVGARRVLEIFSRLHEPDEKANPEKWPTLNYEAGQPKTRP